MSTTKTRAICRHMIRLLLIAMLVMSSQGVAQTISKPVVLSLKPYASTSLKTVDVKVGAQTVPFLFDTGGGLTVVTPDVAKRLGCIPFGQVTGFRATGEKITEKRCGPVTLQIGAYLTHGETGVFDLMGMIRGQVERARKAGKDVPMPPTLGGLIGLSSFQHQIITLDYAHDRIIVETPRSALIRTSSMQPVKARVASEASGSVDVFLQARAQTGTLWLELDSGNNGPTLLAPHAIRQLGMALPKGKRQSLDIDLIGLGKVPATVMRRPMIYDGQLGIALIDKLVVTIDLANGHAWAKALP